MYLRTSWSYPSLKPHWPFRNKRLTTFSRFWELFGSPEYHCVNFMPTSAKEERMVDWWAECMINWLISDLDGRLVCY